jgi:DNA-binding NarL/FixJ family response regulator
MANNIKSKNIIIADSQYLICESLRIILQQELHYIVNRVVTNKENLIDALTNEVFSILIVDYAQIDFDGLYDLKKIKTEYPNLFILILTNSVSKRELMELNNIGIKNILLKTVGKDELISAITATLSDKKYYSEEILETLFESNTIKKTPDDIEKTLTSSEIEIIRLIGEGLTTKDIASRKFISFHTVLTHRKNILRKLGLSNASDLIMYAIKVGIIDIIEYHI